MLHYSILGLLLIRLKTKKTNKKSYIKIEEIIFATSIDWKSACSIIAIKNDSDKMIINK